MRIARTLARAAALLCALTLPLTAFAGGWMDTLANGVPGPVLRFVTVPEEAFPEEGGGVIAVSGDGVRALVAGKGVVRLWDTQKHEAVPLRFTREEDIEYLNSGLLAEAALQQALMRKAEDRDAVRERVFSMAAAFCAQTGADRIDTLEQIAAFFNDCLANPLIFRCWMAGSRYALVYTASGHHTLAVNLDSGACRLLPADASWFALCGSLLLYPEGILDLDTGETAAPRWKAPDEVRDLNTSAINPLLFADGGMAAVMSSASFGKDEGGMFRDLCLVEISETKNSASPLGKFYGLKEPSYAMASGNERYLMLYNPSYWSVLAPWVYDRESGAATELDACLLPLVGAEGGFVCYSMETNEVVLLNAASLEQEPVTLAIDASWPDTNTLIMSRFVSDAGTGRLFFQDARLNGYFVFAVESR